jgi:hypothetical protein
LIRAHNPRSRERGDARDRGEGGRHSDQKRKTTAAKRLIGAGKYERQDRQYARTDDGQHTAHESQNVEKHVTCPSMR